MSAISPISWEQIRFFLAAAQAGSLNAAASRAGVDHTTLSRRIRLLEERLGVRLFDRAPTGLTLTNEGASALVEAEQMEAAAIRLVRGRAGNDARLAGTVRLSLTEGLASHWLVPRITEIRTRLPQIEIIVDSTSVGNEMDPASDISIRYAAPTNLDLVGRRGPTLNFRLFGAPAYKDRHGLPSSVQELGEHSYIDHTVQRLAPSLDIWCAMLASFPVRLRTSSYIAVLSAMNEGIGLSLQPVYALSMAPHLVAADIDLGFRAETWVTYPADRRHIARVRAIVDEIVMIGQRDQDTFFNG